MVTYYAWAKGNWKMEKYVQVVGLVTIIWKIVRYEYGEEWNVRHMMWCHDAYNVGSGEIICLLGVWFRFSQLEKFNIEIIGLAFLLSMRFVGCKRGEFCGNRNFLQEDNI